MGGSQQDLRRFASLEDLDQEPGSRELKQIDYPVNVEVTRQDCQGEPPFPHHLMGQQGGCEAEQYTQGQPEIKEPQDTDDPDTTVTEPPCDGESTHSRDKELGEKEGTVSPKVTKFSAELPGEGDADTTLEECPPGQSTAAVHSSIRSEQDTGMEEGILNNDEMTLPIRPQQGHQEHLFNLQEVDATSQHSEHSQSHDHQLQEMPEGVGIADVRYHPLPTDEDSYEQDWEVGKELSVCTEAAPYKVDEPVAVVFRSVCDCADEKCGHQTCWKGKVVNQEGLLELWSERGLGRSLRYPPLVPRRFKEKKTDTEEMV